MNVIPFFISAPMAATAPATSTSSCLRSESDPRSKTLWVVGLTSESFLSVSVVLSSPAVRTVSRTIAATARFCSSVIPS